MAQIYLSRTNPFHRIGANYSFLQHVANCVFENNENITVISTQEQVNDLFAPSRPRYGTVLASNINLNLASYSKTTIAIKYSGYEFLTCYAENYISFEFYLAPFQPELWYGLAVCLVVLISVVSIYLHFSKLPTFPAWLFVIATLFEEGFTLPGQVEKKQYIRLILGTWCLMSITLTNCYNGIMISELNSPLKASQPNKFYDLVCHKIQNSKRNPNFISANFNNNLSHLDISAHKKYFNEIAAFREDNNSDWRLTLQSDFQDGACFKLLSNFIPTSNVPIPEFLDFLYGEHYLFLYYFFTFRPPRIYYKYLTHGNSFLTFNLLNPLHSHVPKGIRYSEEGYQLDNLQKLVEQEIVSCGKNVFTSKSDMLEAEFKFLEKHYFSKNFYKGKVLDESEFLGLVFLQVGVSRVVKWYKFLVEGGIYGRLEREEWENKYLHRKPAVKIGGSGERVTPLDLSGAIVTLFILCGGWIGVTSLVFWGEVRVIVGHCLIKWICAVHLIMLKVKGKRKVRKQIRG
ncbi:hypothetical protein Fcan01_00785 [Folsomia candida]|uniref:Uncharacterized protein n=1 Tax=Folsomia candida TaxID=158441 RepID=A0A226F4I9_FOLCA|nr:hypothetical protein Fcan01_00785 [Folsomia candida]